ncbi:MAG: ATP-dependent Clp protease proteolytic subunit [Phycisphaerae bacterium]|nr:ATP-dependent Clp protease proteolytic subunit [Phycisphaerae bacterium]NIW70365.1 ATP-dependent Clp protease proteolytic subunit [candidate division KSB1 bacterium]NIP56394.1 ATP-dependent Clp protease proteolytic subunit [Phycisphaerae bacterium]NIS54843.1 ATP-dependent Clp protease proteolytic subunit [Phycisphaerae bacterium]NIU12396.1 ATP-dependent Clp protease proteolytic subunit [Phycisphaerae bacterium]
MATNQNLVPIVIEKSGRTERAYDIYSRLLKDRIVFLGGTIDDATANLIIAQMLFLSNEDNKNEIHFYINSPGGSITAGLAIYDTMQFLRCDVATYCVGQAASMAAVLLAGGKTGKRFLLANNRILLHQPLITGILEGPATDLDIEAKEILRLRTRLYDILANHTGQKPEKVEKDCDRNLWFEPEEAINYGLADRILQKAPEIVREQEQK